MAILLNYAVDELRGASQEPAEGVILRDVAEGFDCCLTKVAHRHQADYLGWAIWYARYRRESADDVRCYQMLWPDRDGLFPFDERCSDGVKKMQPLLST